MEASTGPQSALPSPESQQVSPASVPVDEGLWNHLMAGRWARWRRRARDPELTPSQRRYAARRAFRLDSEYSTRLASCSTAGVVVKCGCPGKRAVAYYTCRQHLICKLCRKSRSRRLRARIAKGLEGAASQNPGLMVVMITITLRHSGDVGQDRKNLADGWRRFYKAYHRRFGAFPYVGTWEVTPGTDGLGHPHAHIIALWPHRRWGPDAPCARDEDDLRSLWLAACPQSERIHFKASRTVKNAARYVSKYVSKGVHTDDFTPELRARVLAGTYGTRWLFSSKSFWIPFVPKCPCCNESIRRVILRNPFPDAAHSHRRRYDPDTPEFHRGHQGTLEALFKPD